MTDVLLVRYQRTTPNLRGHHPGVFAMVNGLAHAGRLTEEQYRFWREGNAWFEAAYTDPSTVDPQVYDRELHPGAASWFKATAVELIERAGGYLAILDAHGVAYERVESTAPGRIVYEDEHQVVVTPWTDAVGS
ncbi:hypothetical protein [Streptacidiphilus melanogenes]|uniref:hypothetical protein n=1 Tax=Streptacidiphilus melanogenes TaxID=411235 RepID=UPI0005A8E8FF|nr:hypothetical protein [Streptacidiphilus melanogenes]